MVLNSQVVTQYSQNFSQVFRPQAETKALLVCILQKPKKCTSHNEFCTETVEQSNYKMEWSGLEWSDYETKQWFKPSTLLNCPDSREEAPPSSISAALTGWWTYNKFFFKSVKGLNPWVISWVWSWIGLLLTVTDILTICAVVIFRVKVSCITSVDGIIRLITSWLN